jgi:tetratricopeptide (TPR) repeat protein
MPLGFGATLTLKSGKVISGDIVERDDNYIRIKYKGTPIYYELKYVASIEEDDSAAVAYNNDDGGRLLEENKKLKQELQELKELLRDLTAEYNNRLGDVYIQAELFEEAVKAYENTLTFNPQNPDAEYNLGLLFETYKKDKAKSIEHYRNYLRLKPDAPDRDDIEKIIAQP